MLTVFSKRLKALREDAGLSQAELAAELNISRGSVSFYENGDRSPDVAVLKRICERFDVSSDFMVGLSDRQGNSGRQKAVAAYGRLENALNSLFKNSAEGVADALADLIYHAESGYIAGPILYTAFLPIMEQLQFIVNFFNEAVGGHIEDMEAFHENSPLHVSQETAADGYGCDPERLDSERDLSKKVHAADFASQTASCIGDISVAASRLLNELREMLPSAFDQAYDEHRPHFK